MTHQGKIALSARFARILAFATLTAAILGPLLARLGIASPMSGFLMFALALPFAVAAILLGLVGLFMTRRSTGRAGAGSAMFAALIGSATLLIIGGLGRASGEAPAIHDITTNLDDPPSFVALAEEEANRDQDLTYPHGPDDTVELHRSAYSDLQSMHLMRSPSTVFAQAKAVAADLGWRLVSETAPTESGADPSTSSDPTPSDTDETNNVGEDGAQDEGEGTEVESAPPQPVVATIEATATSSIFRFVDDIVVRIEGPDGMDAAHSMVDIRSKSRDGQSDLGVNAKRIRAFIEALNAASN